MKMVCMCGTPSGIGCVVDHVKTRRSSTSITVQNLAMLCWCTQRAWLTVKTCLSYDELCHSLSQTMSTHTGSKTFGYIQLTSYQYQYHLISVTDYTSLQLCMKSVNMLVRYAEVQGNENAGLQNGGLNSSNEKTMEMVQFSSPVTTLHFPVLFPLSHIWLSYEDIHLQLDDF